MHMSDALISPSTGGIMWAVSGITLIVSSNKLKKISDDSRVPLMGVMGAFIFASQMINFTIPGTGSSGHLTGALLLAIILGPSAGFIVISSTLIVQSLFFADGGLLALGCNMFNMGIIPCFIVYPFYQSFAKRGASKSKLIFITLLSTVLASELGAFFVVLETKFSGIAELPFSTFLMLMLPIHLPIGLVEGGITTVLVNILSQEKPEILNQGRLHNSKLRPVYLLLSAFFIAGFISLFASSNPDGLEWAITKTSKSEEINHKKTTIMHNLGKRIQDITSFLPSYGFKKTINESKSSARESLNIGKTIAGLIGSTITLITILLIAFFIKIKYKKQLA